MDRQIGVQIEGERYIRLVNIDKERHGKLKFTTIQDEQRRALIKVYLFENDRMIPLKEIEVGSIPPEKAGVPEIDLSIEFDGKKTLNLMVTLNGRSRSRESVEISKQSKGMKKSLVLVPVVIIILVSVFFIIKRTALFKTGDTARYLDRKELAVGSDRPDRQQTDNVKTEKEKGPKLEAPRTVEKEKSAEISKTTQREESSKSRYREEQPEVEKQSVSKEKEVKSSSSGLEKSSQAESQVKTAVLRNDKDAADGSYETSRQSGNNYEYIETYEPEAEEISSYTNEYVQTDIQEDVVYEPAFDTESGQYKTEMSGSFTGDGPLKTVYFEPGRAALTFEAFEELDKIISFLKENEDKKVFISGHCALYSTEEGRLQLSEMRASNVYWYLRDQGWKPRTKPDVSGFGGTQFVTADPDSQNMNRRVEIRIED